MWRRGDGSSSQPAGSSGGGVLIAAYGIFAYVLFLLTFLYLIGFVADADFMVGNVHVVGKTIDRGGLGDGTFTVTAVVIDVALLALFAVQHSIMARAGFKRWWTRIVPPSAERSTYVLASNVCLIALIAAWHPITDDDIWLVTAQPWRTVLIVTGLAGWAIALLSTVLIDHFDLFGLRQVFARTAGPAARRASVHDAAFLPGRSTPAISGLSDRILGDTTDDVGALALCGRRPPATSWSLFDSRSATSSACSGRSTATTVAAFRC